jgi:hypothetical protein
MNTRVLSHLVRALVSSAKTFNLKMLKSPRGNGEFHLAISPIGFLELLSQLELDGFDFEVTSSLSSQALSSRCWCQPRLGDSEMNQLA